MNLNITSIVNVNGTLSSNQIELTIPITSNIDNLNAFVDVVYPSDFTFCTYSVQSQNPSIYDDATKRWTVSVNKDEIAILKILLDFNEPTDLTKTYNFSWAVTGIDTDLGNNNKTVPLEYKKVFTDPLGATNPSIGCGGSVNVTLNDTECTDGVSEWRLNNGSVVNSTTNTWDNGQGCFNYVDSTLPITGTYDLYCIFNGTETLISCDETFTIPALIDNKDIFNHTISFIKGDALSVAEITLLESQHNLTAVDYCWHVIKNGDGVVTSGLPLNCEDEDVDNRTRSICLDQDYVDGTIPTELSDIVDNESGDNAIVLYNDGIASYGWTWTNADCTVGVWGLCKFVNSAGQGSAGPMGSPGTNGTNGVNGIDGASAYQTWLTLGNTGTEQEFIDSLQGQDGSVAPLVVDGVTISGDGSAASPLSVINPNDWGTQVIEHEVDSLSEGDGTITSRLNVKGLIEATYTEIKALADASGLKPGQNYKITDFQTVHTIPYTTETNTGAVEPLFLTALDESTFKKEAFSYVYENDVIYYDIDSTIDGATKGRILRRVDTFNNIDITVDWREVRLRRWKLNPQEHIVGNTYSKGDLVVLSNQIYIARVDNSTTPSGTTNKDWVIYSSTLNTSTKNFYILDNPSGVLGSTAYGVDTNDFIDELIVGNTSRNVKIINVRNDGLNSLNVVIRYNPVNIRIESPIITGVTLHNSENIEIISGIVNGVSVTGSAKNLLIRSGNTSVVENFLVDSLQNFNVKYGLSGLKVDQILQFTVNRVVDSLFHQLTFSEIDILNNVSVHLFSYNRFYNVSNLTFDRFYSNDGENAISMLGVDFYLNKNVDRTNFGAAIDLSLATHVQDSVKTKFWYRRSATSIYRLYYFDNTDTMQISNITA